MTRSLFATSALIAALAGSSVLAQDGATLTTADSEQYGQYLADSEGRPVYLFTADESEGGGETQISCTSQECLDAWPLFTSSGEPMAGDNVDESLIGTMKYEGQTVVTYNGWPLYYFAQDEGADSPQGQEIESFGGEWYLVTAEGTELEGEQ